MADNPEDCAGSDVCRTVENGHVNAMSGRIANKLSLYAASASSLLKKAAPAVEMRFLNTLLDDSSMAVLPDKRPNNFIRKVIRQGKWKKTYLQGARLPTSPKRGKRLL